MHTPITDHPEGSRPQSKTYPIPRSPHVFRKQTVPPPRAGPKFSMLKMTATKILPAMFFICFLLTGTVILIYTLIMNTKLPYKFTVSAALTFAGIFILFLVFNLLLCCRTRFTKNERLDVELGEDDGSKTSHSGSGTSSEKNRIFGKNGRVRHWLREYAEGSLRRFERWRENRRRNRDFKTGDVEALKGGNTPPVEPSHVQPPEGVEWRGNVAGEVEGEAIFTVNPDDRLPRKRSFESAGKDGKRSTGEMRQFRLPGGNTERISVSAGAMRPEMYRGVVATRPQSYSAYGTGGKQSWISMPEVGVGEREARISEDNLPPHTEPRDLKRTIPSRADTEMDPGNGMTAISRNRYSSTRSKRSSVSPLSPQGQTVFPHSIANDLSNELSGAPLTQASLCPTMSSSTVPSEHDRRPPARTATPAMNAHTYVSTTPSELEATSQPLQSHIIPRALSIHSPQPQSAKKSDQLSGTQNGNFNPSKASYSQLLHSNSVANRPSPSSTTPTTPSITNQRLPRRNKNSLPPTSQNWVPSSHFLQPNPESSTRPLRQNQNHPTLPSTINSSILRVNTPFANMYSSGSSNSARNLRGRGTSRQSLAGWPRKDRRDLEDRISEGSDESGEGKADVNKKGNDVVPEMSFAHGISSTKRDGDSSTVGIRRVEIDATTDLQRRSESSAEADIPTALGERPQNKQGDLRGDSITLPASIPIPRNLPSALTLGVLPAEVLEQKPCDGREWPTTNEVPSPIVKNQDVEPGTQTRTRNDKRQQEAPPQTLFSPRTKPQPQEEPEYELEENEILRPWTQIRTLSAEIVISIPGSEEEEEEGEGMHPNEPIRENLPASPNSLLISPTVPTHPSLPIHTPQQTKESRPDSQETLAELLPKPLNLRKKEKRGGGMGDRERGKEKGSEYQLSNRVFDGEKGNRGGERANDDIGGVYTPAARVVGGMDGVRVSG